MQLFRKVIATLSVAVTMVLAISQAHAQISYSGDTTGKPTFNRPNSTTAVPNPPLAVPYEAFTFTPATTGFYRIVSKPTTGWNNFVAIYATSFNPASPLTNIAAVNDTLGQGAGWTSIGTFTAGSTYIVVTTGSANTEFGPYTNTIDLIATNGTTTGGSTFNRPASSVPALPVTFPIYPVDALSTSATAVAYQTKTFTPTESGLYSILVQRTTTTWNPFMALYKGTFNPATPLQNALIANDDSGSATFASATISLEAGQLYTLVVTGSTNADAGDYYYAFEYLYPFKAGLNSTTTGRPTVNVSTFGALYNPAITDFGNAVPYRLFKIDFATPGNYQLLYLAQTPGLSPFIALYVSPFDPATVPSTATLFNAITYRNSNAFILNTGLTTLANNVTLYAVVAGHTNAMVGDFRLEGFGPGAVTITPVTTVKGAVALKTFVDNPPATTRNFDAVFVFRPVGGGSDIIQTVPLTSANGNYVLNVPEGNYNVGIKNPRTLQKVTLNVNASTANVSGLDALLLGADANEDNFTDINDLSPLISAYNQVSPAAGYNALVDFNFDGTNDINDLLIVIGAYNQSGQFLP